MQPIDGTYVGELTLRVSVGKNDPTASIVCVYGNRLEGAVFAERTPNKVIEKTVDRGGETEVLLQCPTR